MVKEQIKQLYETPKVGVYETNIRAVICQSGTSETSPEGDTSGWFE